MKLNNRGYTMIEILAAMVISIIISYTTYSYISYISNLTAQMRLTRIANDNVQAIVESIRFNLSLYQVTFNDNLEIEKALLASDKLPYGIVNGALVPRSECKTKACQAYLGYVIIPSLFVRNVYQVDLKIALPTKNKEDKWKAYTYFITVK
jgi:prepilin-type N-terminal cleavage/methylation domain-containing protein